MKIETAALITKGWCLISGAMAATLVAELNGPPVELFWGITNKMLLAAYAVGCNALVAFLSQSFGNYLNNRATNGNGLAPPKP